ncbi:hypothetical protein IV203_034325 [Nitzschia inconspicua]|uniref:DUF6824 domain-containing protein n=1 Tax=Nitzschia inconspicua TaxID=303405 RepID=A0A9K3Q7H3_9STRA|nr:hypothetical protein IV203_034325 [Nitzschia inconspicua]
MSKSGESDDDVDNDGTIHDVKQETEDKKQAEEEDEGENVEEKNETTTMTPSPNEKENDDENELIQSSHNDDDDDVKPEEPMEEDPKPSDDGDGLVKKDGEEEEKEEEKEVEADDENNDEGKKDLSLVEQAQAEEVNGKGGPAPPDAVRPKNNDILFGRGKPFQNHPGNRKMLGLIDQYKQQYSESPRDRKRPIVEEIIGMLTADGGRFLRRYNEDVNSNWWIEVNRQVAFDKVSHAFRSRGRPKLDKNATTVVSMQRQQQQHHHPQMGPYGMPIAAGGPHPHHPHPHHPHFAMPMGQFGGMMAAMGRGYNPMFPGFMPPQGGPPLGGSPGQGSGGDGGQGPTPPHGGGGPHGPYNPADMEQMFLENQRRAAAFGFGNPAAAAAFYGAQFAGPGDGGFGFPPGGGYPPPPPQRQQHQFPHQPPTQGGGSGGSGGGGHGPPPQQQQQGGNAEGSTKGQAQSTNDGGSRGGPSSGDATWEHGEDGSAQNGGGSSDQDDIEV